VTAAARAPDIPMTLGLGAAAIREERNPSSPSLAVWALGKVLFEKSWLWRRF
jgi:hypothetical protein